MNLNLISSQNFDAIYCINVALEILQTLPIERMSK